MTAFSSSSIASSSPRRSRRRSRPARRRRGGTTSSDDRVQLVVDRVQLAAPQPAPLALGQPAPDAEALVVGQRVLQALGPDLAARADPLRLPGGTALLGEERLR